MGNETRQVGRLPGPGPYLAKVTNWNDPTYMGGLEVVIIKGFTGDQAFKSQTYTVKYLSPFYGVTNVAWEGTDPRKFDDVQKSYGMWMVPPDIGTRVLVIFIDGDVNQGYWLGCVPDTFQNHMVPGIAASQDVYLTPEEELKYGTKYLPVAEFHKRSSKELIDPNSQKKPIHPFADRLLAQGLLIDNIRGVTSSSARRETRSSVFGFSTPGPLDPSGRKAAIGYEDKVNAPISRLGGTQFVMDDGDGAGQNELVRIRTRTGHQILLHNSADLIYIANSKGTAWLEMTSAGKIDIYAQDSISIHSEQDFNFRADRDINFEASRNINMNSFGGMEINCRDRFYLVCDKDGKIFFKGNANLTAADNIRLQSGSEFDLTSGGDSRISANAGLHLAGETGTFLSSGGNINLGASGNIIESATQIHLNGPAAEAAANAVHPDTPIKLELFELPARNATAGWANGKFYKAGNIDSIMQRVPMHEPWDHHENTNPGKFTSASTDVNVTARPSGDGGSGPTAPPPSGQPGSQPPINGGPAAPNSSKNVGENEKYLQAILVANGVSDPIKLAAWMAQCKVESDGFRALREYASGAEYEGRKDLGNTQPGDGVRYKGRGFIQLTGRTVYRSMTKYFNCGIDFDQNPELVETLEWAAKSVLYFFNVFKPKGFRNYIMTQRYQDTTEFWDDVLSVTGLVNGGTNGLAQRKQAYAAYKAKFQSEGVTPQGVVGTGTGGVLTDSYGNPVRTGK